MPVEHSQSLKYWPDVNEGWKVVKRETIALPNGPGIERVERFRTFGVKKSAMENPFIFGFFDEIEKIAKKKKKKGVSPGTVVAAGAIGGGLGGGIAGGIHGARKYDTGIQTRISGRRNPRTGKVEHAPKNKAGWAKRRGMNRSKGKTVWTKTRRIPRTPAARRAGAVRGALGGALSGGAGGAVGGLLGNAILQLVGRHRENK